MIAEQNKIPNLLFNAVQSNILETMRKDEAYYPGEKLSDPLENGTEYDWN